MSYNQYARSLYGQSVIGFVAKAGSYTGHTTLADFAANAAQGEIGIFNPATGNLYTSALTEGQPYIVAQIRDGWCKQSPSLVWSAQTPIFKRSYSAPVNQVWTTTFTYSGDGLSQDSFELKLIETTPLNQHFPIYNFAVTDAVLMNLNGTPTAASADVIAQIFVAQINNLQNPVYAQSSPLVTASWGGAGTGQLILTTIDPNSHFKIAFSGPDTSALAATLTTPFAPGTGLAKEVAYVEAESFIFDGVKSNYPVQALPSEFHSPTSFVDLATPAVYDQFFITNVKTFIETGVNDMHPTPVNVYIAAVASTTAGQADTVLTTVLGPGIVLTN